MQNDEVYNDQEYDIQSNDSSYVEEDYAQSLFPNQQLREHLLHEFLSNSRNGSSIEHPKMKDCFLEYLDSFFEHLHSDEVMCPVKFDGISCWPLTHRGILSVIPCFEELNGVPYNSSGKLRNTEV